jgi:hypothetical protein
MAMTHDLIQPSMRPALLIQTLDKTLHIEGQIGLCTPVVEAPNPY